MDKQQEPLRPLNTDEPGTTTQGHGLQNPGRRRFGHAGLGTSGVLMTLACKPVLGGVVCKSPSGFLSANQSTHGGQVAICSGRRAQYWAANENWPIDRQTKFSQVFSSPSSGAFSQLTLGDLIARNVSDVDGFGMCLVAALLNSRMGWTPFLPEDRIRAMYLEWRTKGYFSPTATVKWTAVEIVSYLQSTQA